MWEYMVNYEPSLDIISTRAKGSQSRIFVVKEMLSNGHVKISTSLEKPYIEGPPLE